MTESITNSSLFNNFAVFREILQSITAFTSLYTKSGRTPFTTNARYFEDMPNPKGSSFVGYPIVVIETEASQESLTIKNKKQMMYTTTVSITSDYFVETDSALLNSYLNAIVYWFNNNKNTLRYTYGLWGLSDIDKDRDRDEIAEKQVVVGMLTFNYHVTLDMVD